MTQAQTPAAGETKERILDSAEGLFAERGFDGTSLRSITTHAQVNLAAVHYHFGSKEALLQAVLARRLEPINRRRLTLLDAVEADAGDGPVDLEAILRAFLEPPLCQIGELGEAGVPFVRLAGRAHSEPNPQARALFLRSFQEVVARYVAALRRALPEVGADELHWKLHFMVGAMAHILSFGEHDGCASLMPEGLIDVQPLQALEAMIAFCSAGMAAPLAEGRHRGAGR